MMTFSIRLDPDLQEQVEYLARTLSRSKSDVVREAIQQYCARAIDMNRVRPYAMVEDLVGCCEGPEDLAVNARKYIKEAMDARRNRPR